MRHKIGDRQRVQHILKAIDEIDKYAGGLPAHIFFENSLIKSACVYQLQVMGEAANHITRGLKAQHQYVPWQDITGLRNIVVHEYWGVDFPQVWNIIKQDLPPLRENMQAILETLPAIEDAA